MRPEAAAGAREARGRVCHCPGNDARRPPPPRGPESSSSVLWRPWMLTPGDAELTRPGSRCEPGGDQPTLTSKGAFGFQHPVRLYLPISKRQEYLRSSGEKVLASFPVQATIHFYNDESEPDSDEEEQGEGAQPCPLQCQGGLQEDGPRGERRARPIKPTEGRGGLGDAPGDSERPSSK